MLIIDTGVLVSIADTTDPHHDACTVLLQNETDTLVTTAMVIAETAYLLDLDLGPDAEALLYQMILDLDLHVDALTIEDWQRVHQLVLTYADLRLGGTDASLIALAERHRQRRIATLNRRHLAHLRGIRQGARHLHRGAPRHRAVARGGRLVVAPRQHLSGGGMVHARGPFGPVPDRRSASRRRARRLGPQSGAGQHGLHGPPASEGRCRPVVSSVSPVHT